MVGIFNAIWTYKYSKKYEDFIPNPYVYWASGLMAVGSTFVLTNSMIPISLIISLEMVKMAQAYFINIDDELYFAENGHRAKVFTSSLNEELGQI